MWQAYSFCFSAASPTLTPSNDLAHGFCFVGAFLSAPIGMVGGRNSVRALGSGHAPIASDEASSYP
jgi:hypothetical protein